MVVIVAAIIIVLVMAMYVKPLVTGKEVKLIPDELADLLKGNSTEEVIVNSTEPEITEIIPPTFVGNETVERMSVGIVNINESTQVRFTNSTDITDNYSFYGDYDNVTSSLILQNVTIPPGNFSVELINMSSGDLYNNSSINILVTTPTPTPVPTWDGKPKNTTFTPKVTEYYGFPSRPYPEEIIKTPVNMSDYIIFGGVVSGMTGNESIPYPYFDIEYTVENRGSLAVPADGEVFEFNRKYKETRKSFQAESLSEITDSHDNVILYYYDKSEEDLEDPGGNPVFKPSKNKILTLKPDPEDVRGYEDGEEDGNRPLVESVSYGVPSFKIIVNDLDNPKNIQEVSPPGGIDPLNWDEARHREASEKMFKEKGLSDRYDSDYYQDYLDNFYEGFKDPRPWTERLMGSGNYSFTVETKNIDSYQIKIKVPTSPDLEVTPTPAQQFLDEREKIFNLFSSFLDEYNADPTNRSYMSEFNNRYTGNILSLQGPDEIIKNYRQVRTSGVTITNNTNYNAFVRGNTGNVYGTIELSRNGILKPMSVNINFLKVGNEWKIDTLPDIRMY